MRPTKKTGAELESFNNKFLARIVGLKPLSVDTAESFCRRRNATVRSVKAEVDFNLKFRWCQKIVGWVEHIRRHPDTLQFVFMTTQGDEWLRERRMEAGGLGKHRSLDSGQTNTRAGPGAPNRFFSGWLEALDSRCEGQCKNASRDKALGRTHASLLYELVFLSSSTADLALEDA